MEQGRRAGSRSARSGRPVRAPCRRRPAARAPAAGPGPRATPSGGAGLPSAASRTRRSTACMPGVSTWLMQRVSPAASNCQAPCLISSSDSAEGWGAAAVAMAADVLMSRRGIPSASKSGLSQAHTSTGPPAMPAADAEYVVVLGSDLRRRPRRCRTRFGAAALGCAR